MAEVALEAMEDMAGEQTQPDGGQPAIEPKELEENREQPRSRESEEPTEEPVEKPSQPPPVEPKGEPKEKPKEPVEETAEEEGVLPKEDLKALFESYGEEVVEEPPPYQPPAQQQFDRQPLPQSQRQTPELPPDVLQVTPHQFMPEGQEFDPTEQHIPGTLSNTAALRAQQEQNRRFNVHERERYEQEQIAQQNMTAMDNLDARMEREKWPKALRQKFWKEGTGNPLVLDMLADGFLLKERQALRKARKTQQSGGNGESPAPVTKASRVTDAPSTPNAAKKEADELFGPRQEKGI